jgi:hypothetical protein
MSSFEIIAQNGQKIESQSIKDPHVGSEAQAVSILHGTFLRRRGQAIILNFVRWKGILKRNLTIIDKVYILAENRKMEKGTGVLTN